MEYDRYQHNNKIFIIGLLCLLVSLSLLAFSIYILPYLLWNWTYNVPGFILDWRERLKEFYNFTDSGASWTIFLIFIIPAIICGYISQLTSNYMDNQIEGVKPETTTPEPPIEVKGDIQETIGFGLKIFLLIILVLVLVALLEWLIATPPPF